jgi:N utilization substance protein B
MRERSRARGWALQVLYAWDARQHEVPLDEAFRGFIAERRINPATLPYLRRLMATLSAESGPIDRELQASLHNWRLDRLSVVDRNVLRIGAAELLHHEDVPPRAAIQEAIRLAEKYGTAESPRFVNGVLDALMRRAGRTAEQPAGGKAS